MPGLAGKRGEHNGRIHRAEIGALEILLAYGKRIGKKDRMQAPDFGEPRDLLVIADIGVGEGIAVPVAPGAGMHSEPHDHRIENEAIAHGWLPAVFQAAAVTEKRWASTLVRSTAARALVSSAVREP